MKDLKDLKRHVIICLTSGYQVQYSTVDRGTSDIQVVDNIICDPGEVKIVYSENGKVVGKTYSGFPYILEMW